LFLKRSEDWLDGGRMSDSNRRKRIAGFHGRWLYVLKFHLDWELQ
jgi:hypothetical protein